MKFEFSIFFYLVTLVTTINNKSKHERVYLGDDDDDGEKIFMYNSQVRHNELFMCNEMRIKLSDPIEIL